MCIRDSNNRPYIVSRFGILVLMAAVGLCCSFTAQYFAAKASVGCATELRQAVFDPVSYTHLDVYKRQDLTEEA